MARIAVGDGISVVACTPHILPGVYHNTGPQICASIAALQNKLREADIPLRLTQGADIHLVPDIVAGLRSGRLLSLCNSRYFLLEPPHHIAPPRFEMSVFSVLTAGFMPIITHPERLRWIETHFGVFERLSRAGVWIQLTAGSVTGRFGTRPRYWCERMLDQGMVHILATDAHNLRSRPPVLSRGRDAVAERLGEEEAKHMVLTRPLGVLENANPASLIPPTNVGRKMETERPAGFLRRTLAAALGGVPRG